MVWIFSAYMFWFLVDVHLPENCSKEWRSTTAKEIMSEHSRHGASSIEVVFGYLWLLLRLWDLLEMREVGPCAAVAYVHRLVPVLGSRGGVGVWRRSVVEPWLGSHLLLQLQSDAVVHTLRVGCERS